jgi:hypothetical protein
MERVMPKAKKPLKRVRPRIDPPIFAPPPPYRRKGNPNMVVGNQLAKGNRGYPREVRLAKRFITECYRDKIFDKDPATGKTYLELMCEANIRLAAAGALDYAKEVTNRLEGTPVQTVEVSSRSTGAQIVITKDMSDREAQEAYKRILEGT